MNFNDHSKLSGLHATFSPSQSSWLRYNDEKAIEVYTNRRAAEMGTRLHAWAAETIKLRLKQPKSNKTICRYINDAISYNMTPEVVLLYSERFFGTADAISFRNNVLRIHDLKTGKQKADMEQLKVYAALFCLEYRKKPGDIEIELRIYQNDEVEGCKPEADEILPIMDKIVHLNKLFERLENEEV